jgi:glycosyltransferase involved in cell wall biosynthesis
LRQAWRSFQPDFVYERCNLYFLAGALLARIDRVPLFLEVNSPLAQERARFGGLALAPLARALERWTWRSAARVLPVTRVLADILVAGGVAPERVRVVPNGIVLARFPPRPTRAADETQRLALGFVGFVRDWHGLDTIIDALATQPEAASVSLVVVGDGPVRLALEAQATRLGVAERVRFTGLVPHEAVAGHVLGFDIALQPGVTPYASPLKIFDYMAAGCAIVAPDQPNIREVLEHGRTALLFDPADPTAQWSAIATLLRDPVQRVALGQAAREALIARDHTWRGNAARITGWAADVIR